jgi:dephospho-CoA kinase
MLILGLTGSIGMGKSTTATMFRAQGVPVHDSDATVHALYRGPAVAPVERAFPGVVVDGVVDRAKLGAQVVGNTERMKDLEQIIHPLVGQAREEFIAKSKAGGYRIIVVDIPLLFEIGGEKDVDLIVVCTAPAHVQASRVLVRPGMTVDKFHGILAKQVPDAEKRRRAHFSIDTSLGLYCARQQVKSLLRSLSTC